MTRGKRKDTEAPTAPPRRDAHPHAHSMLGAACVMCSAAAVSTREKAAPPIVMLSARAPVAHASAGGAVAQAAAGIAMTSTPSGL